MDIRSARGNTGVYYIGSASYIVRQIQFVKVPHSPVFFILPSNSTASVHKKGWKDVGFE